jgi:hypothetical protein
MTEPELPSIDIVLDEARRKLDFQFERLNRLNTKSGMLLGIAAVILTLLVTTLLGKQDTVGRSLLIKVALAPIFTSLILSYLTVSISEYDRPPKLERLREHYISKDAEKTKIRIIDISIDAIQKNEGLIEKKVRLIKWSYVIFAMGLGILVVWVCLILWQ